MKRLDCVWSHRNFSTPERFTYNPLASKKYYSMVLTLGLLHKPIEKDWTPFICSVSDVSYTLLGMTVLRRTGLIEVSLHKIRKRRHVARLSHTVPANQILRICIKVRDGEDWRRACDSSDLPQHGRHSD